MSNKRSTSLILAQTQFDLFNFIEKRSKHLKAPCPMSKFCKEYIARIGSTRSPSFFRKIVSKNRDRIPEMSQFDMDTKVRLMFVLSSSVSEKFREELSRNAEIKLDECNRIVEYVKIGGVLRFKGTHMKMAEETWKRKRDVMNRSNDNENSLLTPEQMRKRFPGFIDFTGDDAEEIPPSNSWSMDEDVIPYEPRILRQPDERPESPDIIEIISPPRNNFSLNSIKQEPSLPSPQFEMKPFHSKMDQYGLIRDEYDKHATISPERHLKFLESIQNTILTLELPINQEIRIKLHNAIEKIEVFKSRDNDLTGSEIESALTSCFLIVTRKAKPPPIENSAGLRDFLLFLRNTIISMKLRNMDEFQESLKRTIDELSVQDKRISFEALQSGIGTIIDIVAP